MFGFNIKAEENNIEKEQIELLEELEKMDEALREYVVVGNSRDAGPARMVELRDNYLEKVEGDKNIEYKKMFEIREKYKFLKRF